MPSPDGCFVQVWDAPKFAGTTDYLNGPLVYSTLRDLPGARVWKDRIRSLKTGTRARVIVYGEESFSGPSIRLTPDQDYPTLPENLSGRIASMNIQCDRSQSLELHHLPQVVIRIA